MCSTRYRCFPSRFRKIRSSKPPHTGFLRNFNPHRPSCCSPTGLNDSAGSITHRSRIPVPLSVRVNHVQNTSRCAMRISDIEQRMSMMKVLHLSQKNISHVHPYSFFSFLFLFLIISSFLIHVCKTHRILMRKGFLPFRDFIRRKNVTENCVWRIQ